MTQEQRSKRAWAKWRRVMAEQARSGETVTVFCRRRRLCVPHFYWWKKRLGEAAAAKFVEVKLPAPIPQGGADDSRVEIRLANGRSLLVGPGFDAEHVRALLAVMESGA